MFVPNFEAMSHVTSILGPENHFKIGLIEKRLKYRKKDFTGLLSEVESRTKGSRPRTEKKPEAKAKDSSSEDRPSRGQRQECSRPRPRTQAQVFSKKKRSSKIFFR